MPPEKRIPQADRFWSTTLDEATHKAAEKRVEKTGISRAELVRRAVAKYLDLPEPVVKQGKPRTRQ